MAKIAATYAGTLVGAGFASGQELLQFFACYGMWGIAGVIAAGYGFCYLGSKVMTLGHQLQADGYGPIIYHICGRRVGTLLDGCTVIFLFATVAIMLAGAGAIAEDFWQLPYRLGLLSMAILTLFTAMRGIRAIATANLIVTPLLLLAVAVIGWYAFSVQGLDQTLIGLEQQLRPPSLTWVGSSLLYLSYNLVIALSVLAPLGKISANAKVRRAGAWLGGGLLALIAIWITLLLLIYQEQLANSELPLLTLASLHHPASYSLYAIILLAAMYTTAVAALYGTAEKLTRLSRLPLPLVASLLVVLALACSQLGFARLISIAYPLFGLLACIFTVRLFYIERPGTRSH